MPDLVEPHRGMFALASFHMRIDLDGVKSTTRAIRPKSDLQ